MRSRAIVEDFVGIVISCGREYDGKKFLGMEGVFKYLVEE